jgi:hypothetical protein
MLYAENIASDNERFFNLCAALKEFNLKTGKNINYTIILNVTKTFVKNSKIFDAMKEANIKWVMFGFETASKELKINLTGHFTIIRYSEVLQTDAEKKYSYHRLRNVLLSL